jgi:PKD repeat protein
MLRHQYSHKKLFLLVVAAFLFLAIVCSAFISNQKAHAAPADSSSVLAVSVQPYEYPYTVYEVGQAVNQQVAVGTDYLGPGDPIAATIDWGDGTAPTQESFIDDGITFQIMGAHAYSKVGTYTVTVTIAITAFQQSATGTGTITAVPNYAVNVNNIASTVGQPFNGIIATGGDPVPNDPLSGTIDWGDGTAPTNVTVETSNPGFFQLNATHTYTQAGTWTITVSLNSDLAGPVSATGTATITVAPPPPPPVSTFMLSAHNITARAHHNFSGKVATVTGTISSKGLSITINWGDGTKTSLHLNGGKGTFSVKGSHTYKKACHYSITISAYDKGTGQTATKKSTATVF